MISLHKLLNQQFKLKLYNLKLYQFNQTIMIMHKTNKENNLTVQLHKFNQHNNLKHHKNYK